MKKDELVCLELRFVPTTREVADQIIKEITMSVAGKDKFKVAYLSPIKSLYKE